jgi:O-acetyl-ADP-ribose deacetylase
MITVIQKDITTLAIDAIVNAANNSLLGGGGVDGAIHRAAGAELLLECRKLHGCATGDAKITKGYNLPAKWIIHTVGPVWTGGKQREAESLGCGSVLQTFGEGNHSPKVCAVSPKAFQEDDLLASCYRRSLELTKDYQIKEIAFPAISTGVYRFPVERAANIAVTEIQAFLATNSHLEKVILVCFSKDSYNCYLEAVKKLAENG